jgi:hypothetical protein
MLHLLHNSFFWRHNLRRCAFAKFQVVIVAHLLFATALTVKSALLYCASLGVPCLMVPWAELSFLTCAAGGGHC